MKPTYEELQGQAAVLRGALDTLWRIAQTDSEGFHIVRAQMLPVIVDAVKTTIGKREAAVLAASKEWQKLWAEVVKISSGGELPYEALLFAVDALEGRE